MSWRIRHEGSPRSLEGLSLTDVVEGLQDLLWEPTDEVMGPQDTTWTAIENHPQLADVAADVEPPPPRFHEDEARLDMNPLIDVCLVLLIFFMLTTSYAALQKVLEMPTIKRGEDGVARYTKDKVEKLTIKVEARLQGGKTILRVEDREVDPRNLVAEISSLVKETHKTELLFVGDDGIEWDTVIQVRDAAKGARIQKVHFLEKGPIK